MYWISSSWYWDMNHHLTAKSAFANTSDEAVRSGHECEALCACHRLSWDIKAGYRIGYSVSFVADLDIQVRLYFLLPNGRQ